MAKLLTFEIDSEGEKLEIHGNKEALLQLAQALQKLASAQHDEHLMTPIWGGSELTEEIQSDSNKLIHHVKVFRWEGQ